MICIRCGTNNPAQLNYCQKCNAHLVKMGFSASTSFIDVEEGTTYLSPQRSYPTEYLYDLTCRAHEYIYQGASGDPLLQAYHNVKLHMDDFENDGLPTLLEQFRLEKVEFPEDDYPSQMVYLLNKGIALYHEGYQLMDEFVQSGENETLVASVHRMQDGNDHLGLVGELASGRSQEIDRMLARKAAEERAAKSKASGSPPAAWRQASETGAVATTADVAAMTDAAAEEAGDDAADSS